MKLWAAVLALTLAACTAFTLPQPESPPAPASAVNRSLEATVALVDSGSGRIFCSGVAMYGRVFTVAHCVDGLAGEEPQALWVGVAFYDDWEDEEDAFDIWYDYGLVHYDDVQDVAVLVPLSMHSPPAEAVLSQDGWWIGRDVVVVGHPFGLAYTITKGQISRKRYDNGGMVWLQISAQVAPGNSGGPVYNQYGEVVGLVLFLVGYPHLAGVVPTETLEEILREDNRALREVHTND